MLASDPSSCDSRLVSDIAVQKPALEALKFLGMLNTVLIRKRKIWQLLKVQVFS